MGVTKVWIERVGLLDYFRGYVYLNLIQNIKCEACKEWREDEKFQKEKLKICNGLGCSPDKWNMR